jgi:response regulator RpfG family c-di-GMP phosphodiesterase
MERGVIEWHSVKLDGLPPHRQTVMVTCGDGNTERNVYTQMRYNQLLDEYIEDPSTDIEALFETVKDFLSKSNCTRRQTAEVVKMAEEGKEIQEAERRRKMKELARA